MDNIYWNSAGKHQDLYDRLNDMIPPSGSVLQPYKNKELERMRKAANCYYDVYNNGLYNRAIQFAKLFQMPSDPYKHSPLSEHRTVVLELKMDEFILAAANEQQLTSDPE